MNLLQSLADKASRAYDQINMIDNGRTWKQRTPTNDRSVVGQVAHNGLTNAVGNVVLKPAAATFNMAVTDPAVSMYAQATGNRFLQQAAEQRQQQDLHNSIPGFFIDQGINASQAFYNLGFKAPLLDITGNQQGSDQARTAGLQEFNRTMPGMAVRPAQYGLANLGHASNDAQREVGLTPEATGAQKFFADPIMGTVGTLGLVDAVGGLAKPRAVVEPKPVIEGTASIKPTLPTPTPEVAVPTEAPTVVTKPNLPGVDTTLPAGQKASRFANRTVQNSPEVSAPLKQMVNQEQVGYTPVTNAGRLETATQWLNGKTPDQAYTEVVKSFENPTKVNGQHVVNAIQTAKLLDESGVEADLMKATEIYDNLSRHLTQKGQEIQAASVLNQRTPQGLQYSALQTLRKAGVEATPEIQAGIKAFVDEVKNTVPGSEARDFAVKRLQQFVARQVPAATLDKMISTWKAGLLTGMKTITGNAVSNASFRFGHELSKPLAVVLDKAASLITKDRSQALTYRGGVSGAGEGFAKGWQYFKTGIDERLGVGNKFLENGGREINFKNKAINTYVNGVFRNMAAQDRPFYYSQLRTSLNELATVEGMNKGLKGAGLRDYVVNTLRDPAVDLLQKAKLEADKAVLANDTALSTVVSSARKGIDRLPNGAGKTVLKTGLETTMPFTGVPSAFVSRVIDFTPIGAFKEIGNQIARGAFDQRALTTAISEATTGTSLMWLGSELSKHNMLSGPYPNDPKEQARWKAEGITPNSIKIGNKWVSLNYLGPAGMLFNAGARAQAANQNVLTSTAAYGGMPKDLTQQSFLQGLSNAIGAVNDPGRYLNNYINSQAGSVVPTIVNDVATATDPYQRDRNNPVQAVQSRIPGLRQQLPISVDVYGNQLQATSNPIDRMANPLRPSTERTSPLFSEINRLHVNNLDVTPTAVDKKVNFDGQNVILSDQQRKELQVNVGQNVQNLWNTAIQSPQYAALSDDGKKKMLSDIYSTVWEGEKRKFQAAYGYGQYAQNYTGKQTTLSKKAQEYVSGNTDVSTYAREPGGASTGSSGNSDFYTSPDAEYKYLLAKYDQAVKNKTYKSDAERIRAESSLAKAQVGSQYEKSIRDLYGLGKAQVYGYLTKNPNGQATAEQLISYGDALVNAGLMTYNKFRDKNGDVSIQPTTKTAKSGRSSGGRAKKATLPSSLSSTISATGTLRSKVANAKVKGVSGPKVKTSAGRTTAYKKTTKARLA